MGIVKEYSVKLSTKQAQENLDELNKSLRLQEDLISEIEDELVKYEKQLEKTSKGNLAARKHVNDQITETKNRLKEERSGLKNVTKDRKRANEAMKEAEKNAADYSGVLGMIDSKTGGLISGMKGMTSSVGGATKGFNLMKIAIIGTGIGALLIAILAVSKAFTSSEEGQNKWAKMMGVLGSVTGNLVDMLATLGEGIISVFENPKKAIIDLKNLIVENITNRITSLIETFGFLGSAIKKVFSGDFSGAMDDAKAAGSSYIDTMTGVKNTIDKVSDSVKNLVTEMTTEAKIAAKIADQRATADKLDTKLIVERAEANRKRAELLEKSANREKFTAKQRIEFLTQAGKIEEEITAKEIKSAKLRYDAKVAENKLSKSTKEDKKELAELEAKLINLETQRLNKKKAVTVQISEATRQANKIEKDEAQAIEDFKDDLAVKNKDKKLAAIEDEKSDRIKALEDLKLSETEKQQLLLDIDAQFKEKKKIIEDEAQLLKDEKLAAFLEKQLGKEQVDLAKQESDAIAEVTLLGGTEAQKDAIRKKYAKSAAQIEAMRKEQVLNDAKSTLNQVSMLAGKDSKIGKAMAIASATISGVQGVQSAYSTAQKSPVTAFFPAYPIVQAAIAGAVAVKNISAIKSVDPSGAGGGSIPTPSGSAAAPAIPSAPPAFNVVGASDTNQLATAIGGQSQTPVQAYVVSNDVSTAQELDRNIISGASLG